MGRTEVDCEMPFGPVATMRYSCFTSECMLRQKEACPTDLQATNSETQGSFGPCMGRSE